MNNREMDAQASGRLLAAVESIYSAALAPSEWPVVLAAIASCTGDAGAVLIYIRDDGTFGTIVSPGLETAQAEYDRKWWRKDIRASRTFQTIYSAEIEAVTDRDVITPAEMASHPIYTEFLVRHGLGWYCAASISPDPGINAFVSVQRLHSRPPFSDDERVIVARLARHAERSLRLSIRLMTAELANASLAEALERVGVGTFVLDRLGRVVLQNSAGKALLGDGLAMTEGRLMPQFAGDQKQFSQQLDEVLRTGAAGMVGGESPVLLHRTTAQRPLILYILPLGRLLPECNAQFLVPARAMVLAIDMKPNAPADPTVVRDVFGITLGEARVAALIGSGLPPRDAAQRLGISEETARTVLKRVFAKIGVSRQSELATLLAKLVLKGAR